LLVPVATTAATAARRALLRLVHAELTAVDHHAVDPGDRLARQLVGAHGDEREAAGLPGLAVGRKEDLPDLAHGREGGLEGLRGGAERKIAHVKTIAHDLLLSGLPEGEAPGVTPPTKPGIGWGPAARRCPGGHTVASSSLR